MYKRQDVGDRDDTEEGIWETEHGGNVKLEMSTISSLLTCSFVLWSLTNVVFFCTIKSRFFNTFFGLQTASQYTIGIFLRSEDDSTKFQAAFTKRSSYTKPIWGEVKIWVGENIDRWKKENEKWFQVDKVPVEFLPVSVQLAEGEASMRRSSISFKEVTELVVGEKLNREDD